MRNTIKIWALLVLVLLPILASAQTQLSVSVQDSDSGAPLPYANLWLTKSTIGATTDSRGEATCEVSNEFPKMDTLVVSYVGYSTRRVPLTFPIDSIVVVALSDGIDLLTVTVTDRKPIPTRRIVRKAIKSAADNYATDTRTLSGFYRETAVENDQFVQFTEASVALHYTGYPHPKLNRKQWISWYDDKRYAFDVEADMVETLLLNDFNAPEDRMEILQKRSSNYVGANGLDIAMIGGPLGLTKYDKIKYRYDFLRLKMLGKYSFTTEGVEFINGALCYAIRFRPAQSDRNFSLDQSRKNKFAIYHGLLYIDVESYAVTRFEYALAIDRDYGFFNRLKSKTLQVQVDYRRIGNLWQLDRILEEKTGTFFNTNKPWQSRRTKELYITNNQTAVTSIPDGRAFKSTRYSAVRFAEIKFDSIYWDTTSYVRQFPLSPKLKNQLSAQVPLYEQFARSGEVQELPKPVLAKATHTHSYNVADPYYWTGQPEGADKLLAYLKDENTYARNYFLNNKDAQRRFFTELNNFYIDSTSTVEECRSGFQQVVRDTLRGSILYYCESDSSRSELLAIDQFEATLAGNWIMQVRLNKARTLLSVAHQKPGSLTSTIAIVKRGSLAIIDSISNVWDHRWINDSTLLYVRTNTRQRGNKLYRHQIGVVQHELLLEEPDETFDLNLTQSNGQNLIYSQSASESAWYWYQDSIEGKIQNVLPLKPETEYQLIKAGTNWYRLDLSHNTLAKTKSLIEPLWESVTLPKEVQAQKIASTQDYLLLEGMNNAVSQFHFLSLGTSDWTMHPVVHPADVLSVRILNSDQNEISVQRSNLASPWRGEHLQLPNTLVKRIPTLAFRDTYLLKSLQVKRIFVEARDGEEIPITVLQNRQARAGSQGILLKVYGAYGAVDVPSFSAIDALLAKRGIMVVYAHVRGTSVLGTDWYLQGRTLQKLNSMHDYVDVARYLKRNSKKDSVHLISYGQSAGGLIVGWAANEHHSLFDAVILDHPFVDVIHTMMNPNLPLVTGEYKEWGDPRSAKVFSYLLNYDPYQNIRAQAYPNMLLIGGYLDQQTPIDQQAKYVAALREANTGDGDILLLTDLDSGHAGPRDEALRNKLYARIFGFIKESID